MDSVDVSETGAVDGWLEMAIASIDERLGHGYAAANPGLVGAYVQACALSAIRTAVVSGLDDLGLAVRAARD